MADRGVSDDALLSMPVLVTGPTAMQLAETLRHAGFAAVIPVADPIAVPALLADLVIIDLELAEATDLLSTIRERGTRPPALAIARDAGTARKLRAAGARDVINDPGDEDEVLTRVLTTLQGRMLEQMLVDASAVLTDSVRQRTEQLDEARAEVLERLVIAAEFRDDATRDHTRRVGETSALLAEAAGIPSREVEVIRLAAPLHDVGKIGVPDSVLLKTSHLTAEELVTVKLHPVIGARILWGSHAPVLKMAGEIALCHHERWDGKGYPAGFSAEETPLSARIAGVADVFDALTHDRPYKKAWPIEKALDELKNVSGTQLDPTLVALFGEVVRSGALEKIGWS